MDSQQQRISTLVDWAVANGARLHPSVQVYQDAHTGLSFRVRPDAASPLSAYEAVVCLPTSLSLSYLNALSSPHSNIARNGDFDPLPLELVTRAKPHALGRLILIREYLKGEASFWWPYIQALPQPADRDAWALPPFWPADEAELLDGTNVEVGIEKIKADVNREVRELSTLLERYGDRSLESALSKSLYQWAYCTFSSRSFRPSLVISEEQVQALPDGVRMDDFSVLLPLFDVGNHDMTTKIRWDLVRDSTTGSCCELKVGREFVPGEQVFNNYSMKTNAELLLGYGFIVPITDALHNDYTHVRKRADTPDASEEYLISLRPMHHSSSVLGRQKNVLDPDSAASRLSAFEHVQPDMAWDIFCTLTKPLQREGLASVESAPGAVAERTRKESFFAGRVGKECTPYLEQTIAIIQHKVLQELERLSETDVEIASGDEADLTRNQRLALDYRSRCRLVLENTLESIDAVKLNGPENTP